MAINATRRAKWLIGAALLVLCTSMQAHAAVLEDIINFRQYSPTFASAGQPDKAQLKAVADAGFERIIYIAFTNSGSASGAAIADEDVVAKSLGMQYLQIPVDWNAPLVADFEHFAALMQVAPEKKTLLHCQVNARATAFSFLYRVVHQHVGIAQAKADMNSVWQPNRVWRDFIFAVLAAHGIDPNCDGCDWMPKEYE